MTDNCNSDFNEVGNGMETDVFEIMLDPSVKIDPLIKEAELHLRQGQKVAFLLRAGERPYVGMALAAREIISRNLSGMVKCNLQEDRLVCKPITPLRQQLARSIWPWKGSND